MQRIVSRLIFALEGLTIPDGVPRPIRLRFGRIRPAGPSPSPGRCRVFNREFGWICAFGLIRRTPGRVRPSRRLGGGPECRNPERVGGSGRGAFPVIAGQAQVVEHQPRVPGQPCKRRRDEVRRARSRITADSEAPRRQDMFSGPWPLLILEWSSFQPAGSSRTRCMASMDQWPRFSASSLSASAVMGAWLVMPTASSTLGLPTVAGRPFLGAPVLPDGPPDGEDLSGPGERRSCAAARSRPRSPASPAGRAPDGPARRHGRPAARRSRVRPTRPGPPASPDGCPWRRTCSRRPGRAGRRRSISASAWRRR